MTGRNDVAEQPYCKHAEDLILAALIKAGWPPPTTGASQVLEERKAQHERSNT